MYSSLDFYTFKEARRELKKFGIPYATRTLVKTFYPEEEYLGKYIYFSIYSDEEIEEMIKKSNLHYYVKKFHEEKDKREKEIIRQEAYRLLDKVKKEFDKKPKTP